MKLLRVLATILTFLTTLTAAARVISYAPYTSRIAVAAFQSRTTRHFLATEITSPEYSGSQRYEVVLYDATGAEEPRIVYSSTEAVRWAAMWEDGSEVPRTLVAYGDGQFAFDGKAVALPTTTFTNVGYAYVDNGGPFTRGRYAPVRMGNAEFPFVVYDTAGAVWRVDANGIATRWLSAIANSDNALIGSDHGGTRFIVRIDAKRAIVAGFDGTITNRALPSDAKLQGWITPDDRIYFEASGALWENETRIRSGSIFAIPTSDYRGAWIADRNGTTSTTLLLHSPAGGLQTMWTDTTAPQIEALHAGAFGDALLIQVHRPRPQPDRIAVTDPALAIWRAGQSAPKVYDELFLIEQPTKGFIHVDVDKVSSGEPFVFDSGVQIGLQVFGNVQSSDTDSGGGGDVLQEFGIVRASLKQQLVIPGVGRTLGVNGSNWTTDLTLYNPEQVPQRVEVRFVPTGLDREARANAGDDPRTTITLNAKEIRLIPDVLAALFGRVDSGALFLTPERTINATGRSYARVGAGSYGFGMTAIDVMAAASARFPMTFVGALPGPNFRTNVTLIDAAGRGSDANVYSISSSGIGEAFKLDLAVPAAGQQQINGVQTLVNGGQPGGLVIQPKRGFLVASVFTIDNTTNDPTWFPPDLPALYTRWIPIIGHLSGANGSQFRTDLHLFNPGNELRYVYLVAHPWDPSIGAKQVTILMQANESRLITDAYKTLFGRDGVARLRFYSSNPTSGIRITSRTYTTKDGGTYGNLTPPLNGFQIASIGDALEILGVAGGAAQRTNLGIVEMHMWPAAAGEAPGSAKVEIIDNSGRVIDEQTVTVPIAGGVSINNLFRARGLGDGPEAALIRVTPLRGQFATFATVTDNTTNDSIYLASHLKSQE